MIEKHSKIATGQVFTFLDSGLFFVLRAITIVLGVGAYAAVGWNFEAAQIISTIEQLGGNNKVIHIFNHEGTYIIRLSSPNNKEIEFYFSDAIETLAASSTQLQIKELAGSVPLCEPIDTKIRYEKFLSLVDYAKTTPYGSKIFDFRSLVADLDRATNFMRNYYGATKFSAKHVNYEGIEFVCYLHSIS